MTSNLRAMARLGIIKRCSGHRNVSQYRNGLSLGGTVRVGKDRMKGTNNRDEIHRGEAESVEEELWRVESYLSGNVGT